MIRYKTFILFYVNHLKLTVQKLTGKSRLIRILEFLKFFYSLANHSC